MIVSLFLFPACSWREYEVAAVVKRESNFKNIRQMMRAYMQSINVLSESETALAVSV